MHQMTRTLAFVIAASASVIGAVVAHIATRPPAAEDAAHAGIGQPFYPEFVDPTSATAIRVAAWNPKSNRVEQFEVRSENGQWRIPSHYNYPADATDQLAKAAASAVGIVRGSLVAETADSHERLGVVDPLDENVSQGSGGSGTRITLFDGDDVVADFVVGKRQGEVAVDETEDDELLADDDGSGKQSKEGTFYVRRPDEKLVYLADVNIDVSTRFRDWINKDLLDLSQFDLRKIVVNRYSVDEDRGALVRGDISELSRESSSDPWKLDGLDESKERIKSGVVSAMARALDQLQIVGIRRKPDALVKFFTEGVVDLVQLLQVQSDLQRYGFFFDGQGQNLWANEGEILAGTKDGVTYVLRFGEVFTGSDLEVEVGQSSEAEAGTDDQPESDTDDGASGDAESGDDGADAGADPEASEKAGKRSRYVIVEAVFDPSLLGPEPTPPVKPKQPGEPAPQAPPSDEANKPAKSGDEPADDASDADTPAETNPESSADSPDGDESSCDDGPSGDDGPTDDSADSPAAEETLKPADAPAKEEVESPAADEDKADAAPAGTDALTRPRTPQDEYEEALKQYEQDLEAYETKKEDYDKRVADGKQRVDELNKRFAEWYYVISADLFEDLSVNRDQLAEPIEPADDVESDATATPAADSQEESKGSTSASPTNESKAPAADDDASTEESQEAPESTNDAKQDGDAQADSTTESDGAAPSSNEN